MAEARGEKPAGQTLEVLALNFEVISNPESTHAERARSLCWVFRIVGHIHQPMHVSDLLSNDCPKGNPAATLSYVDEPMTASTTPLHILWDSTSFAF